jgi:HK97 family phage portal protein
VADGLFRRLAKAVYNADQWRTGSAVYADSPDNGAWPVTVAMYEGVYRDCLSIYRSNVAVRHAVSFIAEAQADLPIDMVLSDGDKRLPITDHELLDLFMDPNPELTQFEFIRDWRTDLEIFDVTFWEKVRGPRGKVIALRRMYPDAVTLRGGNALAPEVFRETHADGTWTDHSRKDVLWKHGYGGRRGISPMETLRRFLAEDETAGRAREAFAKNGYRTAGVIRRPIDAPEWDEVGRTRFLEQMAARYGGGGNAGKPLLLEEGMEWLNDATKIGALEYVAERKLTAEMVGMEFGLSPAMMKLEQAAYASLTEENRQVYQNVLAPRLRSDEQFFDKHLLRAETWASPEGGFATQAELRKVHIKFNLDAKLRGSFSERAMIVSTADYMLVDEKRALMDLPPLTKKQREELAPPAPTPGPAPLPDEDEQPKPSDDPQREPKSGAKASSEERGAVRRRRRYAKQLEDVIQKTLDRIEAQEKAHFKEERWERELSSDLLPVLVSIANTEGARKAAQLGGEWDGGLVENYLGAKAAGMAKGIVARARESVSPKMASYLGLGAATGTMNFAREEAAKQTGATQKVWNVTSAKSRHPEWNGLKANIGENFSNGLGYPGDPAGSAEQTAHCECVLDIEGSS